jgi:predicted phosphoribosyltransferase/pimeloyl-ACP methyl ester carboxylesterase
MVGACRDVIIERDAVRLAARLLVPAAPPPVPCVIFVHGLGSSKTSTRNVAIAAHLLDVGIAALLFDLSGHGESSNDPRGEEAFADDLAAVYAWVKAQPQLDRERIGISGSSLGAVVAVEALRRGTVRPQTMVLRGPPLDAGAWRAIDVPSLVVVGSEDPLAAGARAHAAGAPYVTTSVVEGAGHLFDEPGTLAAALAATVDWFRSHLVGGDDPPAQAPSGRMVRLENAYAPLFRDRRDAGAQLGEKLAKAYASQDVLVLGIPRGGVPVADEIAKRLDAELDVVVARKLGAPGYPELAIGAVTANGGRFLNQDVIRELGVSDAYLEAVTAEQREEARRREERFREGCPAADCTGRAVIIVDDGLATGATMRAAVRSVQAGHPAKTLIAVPVGSQEACAALRTEADDVVTLAEPDPFWAVGFYYEQFGQTEDAEVQRILSQAHARRRARAGA